MEIKNSKYEELANTEFFKEIINKYLNETYVLSSESFLKIHNLYINNIEDNIHKANKLEVFLFCYYYFKKKKYILNCKLISS